MKVSGLFVFFCILFVVHSFEIGGKLLGNTSFRCWNRHPGDLAACTGHGKCVSENNCSCYLNYGGKSCDEWKCYQLNNSEPIACMAHGDCVSYNHCKCLPGYFLYDCSTYGCNEKLHTDPECCTSKENGICQKPNECVCNYGYSGKDCERNWQKTLIIVLVSVFSTLCFIGFVFYCCICPLVFVCGILMDFRADPKEGKGVFNYNPEDNLSDDDLGTTFGENLDEFKFTELNEEKSPLVKGKMEIGNLNMTI